VGGGVVTGGDYDLGTVAVDELVGDQANKDARLRRTAVSEWTVDDGAGGDADLILHNTHTYDLGVYHPAADTFGLGTPAGANAGIELEFDGTGFKNLKICRTGSLRNTRAMTIYANSQLVAFDDAAANSGIAWYTNPASLSGTLQIMLKQSDTSPDCALLSTDATALDGGLELGRLILGERSSDPADPAEGRAVAWLSDGTGSGDDGDLMVKITAGAVTKTATLVDFSAA
jgi:hypothetical protein